MNISVLNLTTQDQFYGNYCIPQAKSAMVPKELGTRLAGTPDYASDSKELLDSYRLFQDNRLHVGWSSPFYWCDGYGSIGQQIADALLQIPGLSVQIAPRDYDPSDPRMGGMSLDRWQELAFVPARIVDRLRENQPKALYGVNMTYPADCHRSVFPRTIGYTMFETTAPPKVWTRSMNLCRLLMTPCPQNVEAFRNRGVTVPIHVVPQGVNPEAWPIIDRKDRDQPFTFLMAGGLTYRKNPITAVSAFRAAFPNNPDVRLILKTRAGKIGGAFESWIQKIPRDDRIQIIQSNCSPTEMAQLMAVADCFIWPSRGEGMGLPPIEAMATGLPLICADNSGMSQYLDSKYNFPIPCKEVPVPKQADGGYPDQWGDCGNWWEPNFDCFVETMRNVYKHRTHAYNVGMRSASWVREKWTIMHTCQKILEIVREDAEADGIKW